MTDTVKTLMESHLAMESHYREQASIAIANILLASDTATQKAYARRAEFFRQKADSQAEKAKNLMEKA